MNTTASTSQNRLYIETMGTYCTLDGERGRVTGVTYGPGHMLTGVFVVMEYVDEVRYCEVSRLVGERNQHAEIKTRRAITRDEFDRLNGLDTMRRELGWKL